VGDVHQACPHGRRSHPFQDGAQDRVHEMRQFAHFERCRRREPLRNAGPPPPPAAVQMLFVWCEGGKPFGPVAACVAELGTMRT
jgi:hypothetical protein